MPKRDGKKIDPPSLGKHVDDIRDIMDAIVTHAGNHRGIDLYLALQ
jgi:hypothetical protein